MEKICCAILDDYQQVALQIADWSSLNEKIKITAFHEHFSNHEELISKVRNCNIIIIMRERTPFNSFIFEQLPNLKLLITSGMRNAAIDLPAAAKYGVTVCGTRSLSTPPVELTWALILGLVRNIVSENEAFRNNGPWQSHVGGDLHGKQLGVLGLGKIGSQVARIGAAFGMKVVAWSQNLTKERTDKEGVLLAASKENLLENSDFVSIHLVLSERSKHLIREQEIKRMKSTSYLINTSRALIIEQAALVKALQEKWIAGAGIDVFADEPLPPNSVFRSLSNILATPHLGYVTQNNYCIYFQEAIEDINAFLNGSPIRVLS